MTKENHFDISAKGRYVRRMLRLRWQGQPRVCPYCGPYAKVKLLRRKKFLVEILECETCHLWFRWPADTAEQNAQYYQGEYASDSPQVALPGEDELAKLTNKCFSGSPLDIGSKIRVVNDLCPGGQVLDFGCSWGYGTYQFQRHGFSAVGFEISKPRAEYGRARLELKIIDSYEELSKLPEESFDVVFSNHVVEHLPEIGQAFSTLTRLLRRGGFVFHVLPNFTGKKARSGEWLKWIGEDHPIAPTIPFFQVAIPQAGLGQPIFSSSPFEPQLGRAVASRSHEALSTEGDELLVVASKLETLQRPA